jgi:hypothetical protein
MRGKAEMETPEAGILTTCGLALHLAPTPQALESVKLALETIASCEAGEPRGRWLPVAAETHHPRDFHRKLEAIPGVERCEVVFIGSENGLAPLPPQPNTNRHE